MSLLEIPPVVIALGLFAGMILALEWGRRAGVSQRDHIMAGGAAGVGAIETSIFALLGLLIAFTFQGAAGRFDIRRAQIVQEANAIGTAWLRIDLLPAELQPEMRGLFRQYLNSRLETYRKINDLDAAKAELVRTARLQGEIWKVALAAHKQGGQAIAVSVLPALNQMFDIVTTRTMATKTHPPGIVFVMLTFMAFAASFLAGHGMAGSKARNLVHSIGFAATLAITVFVIMDMEHPRLGVIRIDSFDQVLQEMHESMR